MTRQQAKLLTFIKSYMRLHGYSPTCDEMKDFMGLASKSGVSRLTTELCAAGYIEREHPGGRSWKIIPKLDAAEIATAVMITLTKIPPDAWGVAEAGRRPVWTEETMVDAIKGVLAGYGIV